MTIKLYSTDEKECLFLFLVTEQMQKFNLPAWGSLGVTGCNSGHCEPSGWAWRRGNRGLSVGWSPSHGQESLHTGGCAQL